MATNPYFDSSFGQDAGLDAQLYDDLVIEMIQMKGRDFHYLPRTLTQFDSYFGEDNLPSMYKDVKTIEMYMENIDSWQGEGHLLGKFGLELRDTATLIVSRTRFNEEITADFPDITRPREGDILVFPSPYDRRMRHFEITYVENESVFYQLGDLPTFRVTVKNFEYSGEQFDTGVAEIDEYQDKWALMTDIKLVSGTGIFQIGETVVAGGFSGQVVIFAGLDLTLTTTKGDFLPGTTIVGQTSGASWLTESLVTDVKNDAMLDDNVHIRDSDVRDFSESNPFSGW